MLFFSASALVGSLYYVFWLKKNQLWDTKQRKQDLVKTRPNPFRRWQSFYETQTLVYWYESACLTFIAAWGTSLGWPAPT